MLCNTVEKLIPLGETEVFGTVRPMCGDAVTFTVFSGVSTDQDTGFSKVFYCGSATFGGTDIVDFLLLRDNSSRMCGYFVRVCASGQVSVGRAFQGSGDPLQQIPRAVAVRIGPDAKGFFESTFIKRWGCGGKQVTGFRNSKPDYLTPWACGVDRRNEHLGYRVAGPGVSYFIKDKLDQMLAISMYPRKAGKPVFAGQMPSVGQRHPVLLGSKVCHYSSSNVCSSGWGLHGFRVVGCGRAGARLHLILAVIAAVLACFSRSSRIGGGA